MMRFALMMLLSVTIVSANIASRQLLGGGHRGGGGGGFHGGGGFSMNRFMRPRPNYRSDFRSFAKGVGEGLMKNVVGDHGWDAGRDAMQAGKYMYASAHDYLSGDRQAAMTNLGNAGRAGLACAAQATAQAADDFKDASIDGAHGAALAAVQGIPGADVVVDGGEMVYHGYEIGKDISGAVSDARQGKWQEAGEAVADGAADTNEALDLDKDHSDGVHENTFRGWPSFRAHGRRADDPSSKAVVATELAALNTIFRNNGGASWLFKDGWGSNSAPCTWHGVTCDADGHVVALVLVGNNLSGTFPDLTALSKLTKLDLWSNDLTGDYSGVCSLTELTILKMSDTGLSTPECIYAMTSLRLVHVAGNSLGGTFPARFLTMSSLRSLDISNNGITGEIPHSGWERLVSLIDLDISRNDFTGTLAGLEVLTNLENLEASHNDFSGDIATLAFHARWPHVHHIYINNNTELTGQLPNKTSNMPFLTTFVADDTGLHGALPQSWASLNLRDFSAARTHLEGSLPEKSAAGYRRTDLSGNTFSCPAPENYDQMSVGCDEASLEDEAKKVTDLPTGELVILSCIAVFVVVGIGYFGVRGRQADTLEVGSVRQGSSLNYALMSDDKDASSANMPL